MTTLELLVVIIAGLIVQVYRLTRQQQEVDDSLDLMYSILVTKMNKLEKKYDPYRPRSEKS